MISRFLKILFLGFKLKRFIIIKKRVYQLVVQILQKKFPIANIAVKGYQHTLKGDSISIL